MLGAPANSAQRSFAGGVRDMAARVGGGTDSVASAPGARRCLPLHRRDGFTTGNTA